jgi:hypothetical protein
MCNLSRHFFDREIVTIWVGKVKNQSFFLPSAPPPHFSSSHRDMLRQAIIEVVDHSLAYFSHIYHLGRRYVPGADVIVHYIQNSYQNDPFRVVLELILVIFAVKYVLAKKYKPDAREVPLTEKVRLGTLCGERR